MIRKIVQIGNPALRHIAKELSASEILSDEIQILIDDLIETMRDANGAGLAATQIAAAHRIFGRSRRGRGSARAFHYTSDSTRSFTKERSRN